jgi:hypothetical protein
MATRKGGRVTGRVREIACARKGDERVERERAREGQVPGCESSAAMIFPSRISANEKSTK